MRTKISDFTLFMTALGTLAAFRSGFGPEICRKRRFLRLFSCFFMPQDGLTSGQEGCPTGVRSPRFFSAF